MMSLIISKIMNNSKMITKLDKNIYYKIKYPINRIMIVDEKLDFSLLNGLFNLTNLSFNALDLNSSDDLNNFIMRYSNNKGAIEKDILLFKVDGKNIKKYGNLIKPNYILIGETNEIIMNLENKEVFDSAKVIAKSKYELDGIDYSLNDKNASFYISNIDYIKEKIEINQKYNININNTDNNYLEEILMFFSLINSLNIDVQVFNKLNSKSFSYENKKIFINISNNNYNDSIKFISRYTDYKVIVIGWKNLYEDISWLYNVEFERLINKNIQKIYCVGTNAFDLATRFKYAGLNEKIIVAASNIEVFLNEIRNYNLNVYVLTDDYYINVIKGAKK